MASLLLPSVLLLLCSSIFLPDRTTAISETELDQFVSSLRLSGYNLFPNALLNTDLRLEILAGHAFTLFSPTDSAMFALHMTVPLDVWVQTLRYHVSPRHFTYSSLQALAPVSYLPTLLPGRDLPLTHSSHDAGPASTQHHPMFLSVQGVDITRPGIFYTPSIAVHGLNGLLHLTQPHPSVIPFKDAAAGVSPTIPPQVQNPITLPENRPFLPSSATTEMTAPLPRDSTSCHTLRTTEQSLIADNTADRICRRAGTRRHSHHTKPTALFLPEAE